ncbi:TonB-dependent receptor plug domain-containing protein [Aquimarina sp. TRL1]|uniref:TonB-dependent receptor n=1 Tax=Aquimarina sp. (strain TRL1) TaxID=2736252 RepID=UPI0015885E24|nr:TonB-dependent receptor [Aquimarina sp. TRL1]QKX04789.1 TonB-dependent receptor plug domain-containing protein [Aquimarina sp. TRL1]
MHSPAEWSMRKLFLLLLMYCLSANAQVTKTYKETSLQTLLNEIETSYQVIFSYDNEVVQNKKVSIHINNSSIEDILISLRELTTLEFKKVTERQIIIRLPSQKISICGYVYDKQSGKALPYATIEITNSNRGTITNEEGYFNLDNVSATSTINILYVGYDHKSIPVSSIKKETCLTIHIQQQSTLLTEVLILEYITTGIDKNKNGSLTISNKKLGILPGLTEPDILQSMQLIPGISSPDETVTGIQIRGGSPDQNLILWDDIKMYNTGHFFGMLSAFNPHIVKGATVIKGGADAQYGDRVSGVIDISGDTEVPERITGGLGINGTHADLYLKTPVTDKLGVIVSGRRSFTDVLQTPTYKTYAERVFQNTKITSENKGMAISIGDNDEDGEDEDEGEIDVEDVLANNDFYFYDGSFKMIFDATEQDKITTSGLFTRNMLAFKLDDGENIATDKLQIQNEGISIAWKGAKGNSLNHSIKSYYIDYQYNYHYTEKEKEGVSIEDEITRENTVQDFGFDANVEYYINDYNSFTIGYQFSKNNVFYNIQSDREFSSAVGSLDNIKNNTSTIYSTYKYQPKNKSVISLGVRKTYYSINDEYYAEPRLNITHPITKNVRIKATGEFRYQPISQLVEFDNPGLRLGNNIWVNSDNRDIPVLKSRQVSAGVLFSKKGWNFEIDGYLKKIEGLTSFTNGFTTVSDKPSTGESNILGIDVFLKKRFQNFRTWIGYTYNNVKYTFPDIQEHSFSGNNDIPHNFRISNSYKVKNWEFSLGWLWRSGAPFTRATLRDEDISYGKINGGRLPNYHRLDVSAIYRFNFNKGDHWRGQFGLSFLNIYNRKVPISVNYKLDDNALTEKIELNSLKQQSLGFTPNLVFRMYF